VTGPLSEAVAAADDMDDAVHGEKAVDPSIVIACTRRIVACLRDAEPPYGGGQAGGKEPGEIIDESLRSLRERCDEWEDIYDKPGIATVEELQHLKYADALGVPVSWVRSNVEPADVRAWSDFQPIKQAQIDQQMNDADGGDDKVEIG